LLLLYRCCCCCCRAAADPTSRRSAHTDWPLCSCRDSSTSLANNTGRRSRLAQFGRSSGPGEPDVLEADCEERKVLIPGLLISAGGAATLVDEGSLSERFCPSAGQEHQSPDPDGFASGRDAVEPSLERA
jgi:hypothetical protein